MWLPGLKSDMLSTKATALAGWASARGIGMTRFDYSGHGQSSGRFEDALIGDWLEEAEAVFTHCTSGPQILVGSSTGGHIALLLLRKLAQTRPQTAERLKGLVLIAPAWDLTEELMWKTFSPVSQREVMEKGYTGPAHGLRSEPDTPYRKRSSRKGGIICSVASRSTQAGPSTSFRASRIRRYRPSTPALSPAS